MRYEAMARRRLIQQQLVGGRFHAPQEVVAWLGAVQAQDYLGAKWALGLRLPGLTDAAIEQAFAAGDILRTHVMRPTWHFVAPADIRWLLALTAPRVQAASAYMIRQHGLDAATFARSNAAMEFALTGGKFLTRKELGDALAAAGIQAEGNRLAYLVMQAELDALICSGPRRGKQFTYALLEERVPPVPPLAREDALAELTRRYFTGHGPATAQDFSGWAGLTLTDARLGLELVGDALTPFEVEGTAYWQAASGLDGEAGSAAHLLPPFDEYTVGYKQHDAILAPQYADMDKMALYSSVLAYGGRVVGGWKRTLKRDAVVVDIQPFAPLDAPQRAAFAAAAQRYAAFLGLSLEFGAGWEGG